MLTTPRLTHISYCPRRTKVYQFVNTRTRPFTDNIPLLISSEHTEYCRYCKQRCSYSSEFLKTENSEILWESREQVRNYQRIRIECLWDDEIGFVPVLVIGKMRLPFS